MNQSASSKKDRELILTIVSVLGVILTAVIITFLVKTLVIETDEDGLSRLDRILGVKPVDNSKVDYSMQQAYSICLKKLKEDVAERIHDIRFDRRSSRYDRDSNWFTVFFDIEMKSRGKIVDSWIYCHVSASTGMIEEYRVKGEGNLFNFN